MYYVYILKCSDGSPYTGCTHDLKDRLKRHELGYIQSTKNRLPIFLHMYIAFRTEHPAFLFEKYLKSGLGRAFMKKHNFI